MIKKIVATLLLAGSSPAFAQQLNTAKLDSLFDALAANNQAMGSLAITKGKTVLYSRAIGYGDITDNDKTAATNTTKYRIGSISKMFTATIIFQLIDEGKLTLGTTLDKYFPSIPNAKTITIGLMLGHRSGIHNFTADSAYQTWMGAPKTEVQLVKIIAASNADFLPDEKTSYSNSNFLLLGYIAEKITKQPYKDLLKTRIVARAGLTNTYYGGKINTNNKESRSYTYKENAWHTQSETDMSIPGGAGGIVSTPTDLNRFIETLFAGKLVSGKSLEYMKTAKEGLGMGMLTIPFNGRNAYGHDGSIDGFESVLGYFPDDSTSFAYCSNGTVYPIDNVLIGVLDIYYNLPYTVPSFKAVAVTPTQMAQYTGIYATDKFPLKVTITIKGEKLMAQATGQSAFELESMGNDQFRFVAAGIQLDFNTAKKEMTLHQAGNDIVFAKQ